MGTKPKDTTPYVGKWCIQITNYYLPWQLASWIAYLQSKGTHIKLHPRGKLYAIWRQCEKTDTFEQLSFKLINNDLEGQLVEVNEMKDKLKEPDKGKPIPYVDCPCCGHRNFKNEIYNCKICKGVVCKFCAFMCERCGKWAHDNKSCGIWLKDEEGQISGFVCKACFLK